MSFSGYLRDPRPLLSFLNYLDNASGWMVYLQVVLIYPCYSTDLWYSDFLLNSLLACTRPPGYIHHQQHRFFFNFFDNIRCLFYFIFRSTLFCKMPDLTTTKALNLFALFYIMTIHVTLEALNAWVAWPTSSPLTSTLAIPILLAALFFLFFLSTTSTTRIASYTSSISICLSVLSFSFSCCLCLKCLIERLLHLLRCSCALSDPTNSSTESIDKSLDSSITHTIFSKSSVNDLKIFSTIR